jgi:hypothetical protein
MQRKIIQDPRFRAGEFSTRFMERFRMGQPEAVEASA